ncbi:unnamed protein product, partial [Prorocentrum cordatum]
MGDLSSVQAVIKVCAHQELDESLPAREYFLRLGNHHADRLTNLGREQHPLASPAEADAIWRQVSIARLVAKFAARLLPLWPRLDLQDAEWLAPELAFSGRQEGLAHNWVQLRQSWQCPVCLGGSRLAQLPASKCPGADGLRGLKAEALSHLGHTIAAYDCSDGSFVAVCTRCKLYSTGGSVRGLRERCPAELVNLNDHSMRGRRHCWNRIVKGLHPKEDDITLQYVDLTAEGTLDASPLEQAESPGNLRASFAGELQWPIGHQRLAGTSVCSWSCDWRLFLVPTLRCTQFIEIYGGQAEQLLRSTPTGSMEIKELCIKFASKFGVSLTSVAGVRPADFFAREASLFTMPRPG